MITIAALFIGGVGLVASEFSFLSIGDWGGAAIDDQYKSNVYDVSAQMASTASANDAKFVINTGDNFYWCGIQNTSDYLIGVDYEEPYADPSLQVKWYSALGNHEYGYNVQAQIDYTKKSSTWELPARYYTVRLQLEGENYLTLLFLDTSPCISDYRGDDPDYWDPCMTEYPTCSLGDSDDDFQGPCMFNENILTQNCTAQYEWVKTVLASVPENDWLVVVGHHPLDETDVEDFTSLVQEHGFALYLNGHTHLLNQYSIDDAGAYVTTGAGAMVDTADQLHPLTKAKLEGRNITAADRKHLMSHQLKSKNTNNNSTAEVDSQYNGHTYQTIWTETVAGFTLHTFSSDFTTLTTDFLSYTGDVLHSFSVNKQGEVQ